VNQSKPLDLILLDPDLPDADKTHMLEDLMDRIPVLPVVVRTYPYKARQKKGNA